MLWRSTDDSPDFEILSYSQGPQLNIPGQQTRENKNIKAQLIILKPI
jgi:hypothetical protein